MATPTYWAYKFVNQIISTRSNRRTFLKAATAAGFSVSALGAIGALSGFAGVQTTQDKNTDLQKEIYALMWDYKELKLSTSERVTRLVEIIDKAISDKDPVITQAAAEGLMLFADDRVFEKLAEALEKFPDNYPLQRYTYKLMTMHFILNPQARRNINIMFFKMQENKDKLIWREIWSGIYYWGNFSFRSLRQRLRNARLRDDNGLELVLEHDVGNLIKAIYPPFNTFARYANSDALERDFMLRRFGGWVDYTKFVKPNEFLKKTPEQARADQEAFGNPEKKIPGWKKQLSDESLPMNERIDALLNWDEVERWPREPEYFNTLTKLLDNEPLEIKRVVVAILGSSLTASIYAQMQKRLVGYLLESPDYELVLAAAKALRFRDDLPVDDILKMLEQKKDEKIRQQLEDILLSSLGSPETFWHLVRSFIMTDPKDIDDRKRRADELRIWYFRLKDKGDDVVHQAIPSVPRDIQDMVIEWLQDIPKIKFSNPTKTKTPFTQGGPSFVADSSQGDEITEDIGRLVEIAKKLAEAANKVLTGTSTISKF